MKASLKATVAALVMSSVAIGAVATTATLISVEPAFAKSDKANSKSDGNRGKSDKARGKSADRGKTSERSSSRGKSGGSIEGFFAKLTGQDKQANKVQRTAKPAKPAKTAKTAKSETTFESGLHPSELGNMNGALNANINAVLAHIRNGNGNGPVGHVAVLVAASAAADGAQEVLDRAALFDAIAASDYETLDQYYAALEGVPGDPVNLDIEQAEDKDQAAIDFGYLSFDDYLAQLEVPAAEPDDGIDTALINLGVDVEDRGDAPAELALDSSDPSVGLAAETLMDEVNAEKDILAYWNKNPGGEADPESGLTADEEKLLSALRNRFSEADLEAIQQAVDATNPEPDLSEETCNDSDDLCQTDEDVVVLMD